LETLNDHLELWELEYLGAVYKKVFHKDNNDPFMYLMRDIEISGLEDVWQALKHNGWLKKKIKW
jgi:uncharacterized protein (DUF3820 family)